jgi:hypothetical protein
VAVGGAPRGTRKACRVPADACAMSACDALHAESCSVTLSDCSAPASGCSTDMDSQLRLPLWI